MEILNQLEQTILDRKTDADAKDSYTVRLLQDGIRRIAQKVGEEGVEVALAAVAESDDALIGECADLLYHLNVLLIARDLGWADVASELSRRYSDQ